MLPSRRESCKKQREAFPKAIFCMSQHLKRNPGLGTAGFALARAPLPVFTQETTQRHSHHTEVYHREVCKVLHLGRETSHGSVLLLARKK